MDAAHWTPVKALLLVSLLTSHVVVTGLPVDISGFLERSKDHDQVLEGDPAVTNAGLFNGDPTMATEGHFNDYRDLASAGLFNGDPSMANAGPFNGDPGMANAGVFNGDPAMANAGLFNGDPGLANAGLFNGDPGLANAGLFNGDPGLANAGLFNGNPSLANAGLFNGNPALANANGAEGLLRGDPELARHGLTGGEPNPDSNIPEQRPYMIEEPDEFELAMDVYDSRALQGDCPMVDCMMMDMFLQCPHEMRVPTYFTINGVSCRGCMKCETTEEKRQDNSNELSELLGTKEDLTPSKQEEANVRSARMSASTLSDSDLVFITLAGGEDGQKEPSSSVNPERTTGKTVSHRDDVADDASTEADGSTEKSAPATREHQQTTPEQRPTSSRPDTGQPERDPDEKGEVGTNASRTPSTTSATEREEIPDPTGDPDRRFPTSHVSKPETSH